MLRSGPRRLLAAALLLSLLPGTPAAANDVIHQVQAYGVTAPAPFPADPTLAPPRIAPPGMATAETAPPAPQISEQEALAIFRRFFPDPGGPGKLTAQVNSYGPRATWEIVNTVEYENGSSGQGVGAVDAATGQLIRADLANPDLLPVRPGPLGPTQPEGYARAWAFALVKHFYPTEARSLQPAPGGLASPFGYPDPGDVYRFTWMLQHDGIPVADSTFSVAITRDTLEYRSFYTNLPPNLTFQAGPPKLSPSDALERYRELEPALRYQPFSDSPFAPGKASQMKLVYQQNELSRSLDADTGEFVGVGPLPALSPEPVPAGSESPVAPAALPVTGDEAIRIARELLEVPADAQAFSSGNRWPGPFGEEVDSLNVHFMGNYGSMQIDRRTGLIMNAYRPQREMVKVGPPGGGFGFSGPGRVPSGPGSATADPVRLRKATEAAAAVIRRYYSQLAGDLQIQPEQFRDMGPTTNVFFQRFAHGIPLGYDGVRINMDPEQGAWTSIGATWNQTGSLADPAGAVSKEKALERLISGRRPLLVYRIVPTAPYSVAMSGFGPSAIPQEARLVYQLVSDRPESSSFMLDALTGQPLDWNGGQVSDPALLDQKVAGHWAEGELRYLLGRGALSLPKLDPAGPLKRGDALSLLFAGAGRFGMDSGRAPLSAPAPYTDVTQGSPLYRLIASAVARRMLTARGDKPIFEPDRPVTRAEFAVWAAGYLGLGKVVGSSLQTRSSFADLAGLSREEQTAVSLLEALGLVKAGQAFRGREPLTQAEAAALIGRMVLYQREQ